MMTSWRSIALAAVLGSIVGARVAGAQTVFVRNAPPGETVEAVLNGTPTGTATVDEAGAATIPLNLSKIGKTEIDANVFVDVCDKRHRIVVVERGQVSPAEEGCERRDIQGLFWVRGVNTLVVNLAASTPTLLLIKGGYTPPPDVIDESGGTSASSPGRTAPKGMSLFGGGAYTSFRDASATSCGNVSGCTGHDTGVGFMVGGDFWITRFLAAEAAYLRPKKATASGSDTSFSFSNSVKSDVILIAGKLAIPIGPVRIYGKGGSNYHQTTSDTSQTQNAITVSVGGLDQTIPAATQAFKIQTSGWGWLFGGGIEAWVGSKVALYGEFNTGRIKGDAVGGGEGKIDDHLTSIVVGAKFHIGR